MVPPGNLSKPVKLGKGEYSTSVSPYSNVLANLLLSLKEKIDSTNITLSLPFSYFLTLLSYFKIVR